MAYYRERLVVDLINGSSVGSEPDYWEHPGGKVVFRNPGDPARHVAVKIYDNGDLEIRPSSGVERLFAAGTWTGIRYEMTRDV